MATASGRELLTLEQVTTTGANVSRLQTTGLPEGDMSCYGLNQTFSVDVSYHFYFATSLFCLFIGIVGNLLSIIVFSSPAMRSSSSNVYLLAIAVSDCLYLISVFFGKTMTLIKCYFFLDYPFIDLMNQSEFFCIAFQLMLDLFADYSTSLILAVTVERFIACYYPVRFRHLCTPRRARLCCVIVLAIILVPITPYHILLMDYYASYGVCLVTRGEERLFGILYLIESAVFRIAPVLLIACFNVCIVYKIAHMANIQRRLSTASGLLPSGGGYGDGHAPSRRASISATAYYREDRNRQITIMLLVMSSMYVVFFLPVLVHFLVSYLQAIKLVSISPNSTLVAQNYSRSLYIIGCASDVFFYAFCSSSFRSQLVSTLSCRKRSARDDAIAMTPMATALTPAASHNGAHQHPHLDNIRQCRRKSSVVCQALLPGKHGH